MTLVPGKLKFTTTNEHNASFEKIRVCASGLTIVWDDNYQTDRVAFDLNYPWIIMAKRGIDVAELHRIANAVWGYKLAEGQ